MGLLDVDNQSDLTGRRFRARAEFFGVVSGNRLFPTIASGGPSLRLQGFGIERVEVGAGSPR
jgi:hypothetical protein